MSSVQIPGWLLHLHELLQKMHLPIRQVLSTDEVLEVVLEGPPKVIVEVRPKETDAPYALATQRAHILYRGPKDLPDTVRRAVDITMKVMQRLEPRLPQNRPGVAWIGEVEEDRFEALMRRFRFVNLDRSVVAGREEIQVIARITSRCNQRCPFCSAPIVRDPSSEAVFSLIDYVGTRFSQAQLVLTGGEPTLERDFEKFLAHALGMPGISSVQVQTNAVTLASSLPAYPLDPRLVFFVSLHAIEDAIYDRCTGTKGQLKLALLGLTNLLSNGHRVVVNTVVNSTNIAHLVTLVRELACRFTKAPALHFSILLCPPHRPHAPEFLVRYSEVVAAVEEAAREAERLGIPIDPLVSSTHASLPFCLVPDKYRFEKRAVISETETGYEDFSRTFVKSAGCRECLYSSSCIGLPVPYARRFGFDELTPVTSHSRPTKEEPAWAFRLRSLLIGKPDLVTTLGDVLPEVRSSPIPCALPWTRLELHDGGTFGPCCADYMADRYFVPSGANIESLWKSDVLVSFRQALTSSGHPPTCRTSCPVLSGRTDLPGHVPVRGGDHEVVEEQIKRARALIEGRCELDVGPLYICFNATSYCNYDCLMCHCGEEGSLDDERPASFYSGLEPFIRRGVRIEVNGGEPFASPVFRAFVEEQSKIKREPFLSVTTNGSLITSDWLKRLKTPPFHSLIVSLNAATEKTYLEVNRGIGWTNIRRNIEALLSLRQQGGIPGGLTWSMVIIKHNLHEVEAFAEMAIEDGVDPRFLLPVRNRNGQSIMTDPDAMRAAYNSLLRVASMLEGRGRTKAARDARAIASVLKNRLEMGIFNPL